MYNSTWHDHIGAEVSIRQGIIAQGPRVPDVDAKLVSQTIGVVCRSDDVNGNFARKIISGARPGIKK